MQIIATILIGIRKNIKSFFWCGQLHKYEIPSQNILNRRLYMSVRNFCLDTKVNLLKYCYFLSCASYFNSICDILSLLENTYRLLYSNLGWVIKYSDGSMKNICMYVGTLCFHKCMGMWSDVWFLRCLTKIAPLIGD